LQIALELQICSPRSLVEELEIKKSLSNGCHLDNFEQGATLANLKPILWINVFLDFLDAARSMEGNSSGSAGWDIAFNGTRASNISSIVGHGFRLSLKDGHTSRFIASRDTIGSILDVGLDTILIDLTMNGLFLMRRGLFHYFNELKVVRMDLRLRYE
jgi:hypothetical protein